MTVAARKYDLDAVAPFEISDILNLQPVVKHAIPISSEAKDLVETGKIQLAEVWVISICYEYSVSSPVYLSLCLRKYVNLGLITCQNLKPKLTK